MTHDPTPVKQTGKYNKKQGGRCGGRKWNVWYLVLRCPSCGREFRRLQNTLRGRAVRCVGTDRLQVRAKEQLWTPPDPD